MKNAKNIHVRDFATRGFISVGHPGGHGRTVFLRKGKKFIPCEGEAHRGDGAGHVDHCGLCMHALWGWCIVDGTPNGV